MSLLNGALTSSACSMGSKTVFLKSLGPDLGTRWRRRHCSPQGSIRVPAASLANIKGMCHAQEEANAFEGSWHNPWPSFLERAR